MFKIESIKLEKNIEISRSTDNIWRGASYLWLDVYDGQ